LEHVRAADLGHADGGGVVIHHLLDEDAVGKLTGVATRTVNDEMGSEHYTLLYSGALPLAVSALETTDVPTEIGAYKRSPRAAQGARTAIGTHNCPFSPLRSLPKRRMPVGRGNREAPEAALRGGGAT